MTTDDDNHVNQSGERSVRQAPSLDVVTDGDDSSDFVIDKTKKPSVFKLKSMVVPPEVAAAHAAKIRAEHDQAKQDAAHDTQLDLDPPVASEPSSDTIDVPASAPAAAHKSWRAPWTVLAAVLALLTVGTVIALSTSRARAPSESTARTAATAMTAATAATTAAPAAATPRAAESASKPLPLPETSPPATVAPKRPNPPVGKTKPGPSATVPAAVPSAFTTKPPF